MEHKGTCNHLTRASMATFQTQRPKGSVLLAQVRQASTTGSPPTPPCQATAIPVSKAHRAACLPASSSLSSGSEAGMQQPYPSSRSFQGYDGQAGYDAQARYNPSLMRGQYDGASAGGAPIPFHFRGADGTGYQPMTGAGYPNPMGAGINNFTFAQHASEGAARDGATPASMGNMLPPLSSTATDPSVKSEINPYGAANQAGYGQGGPHQGQNQDSSSRYGGAGSFNNRMSRR